MHDLLDNTKLILDLLVGRKVTDVTVDAEVITFKIPEGKIVLCARTQDDKFKSFHALFLQNETVDIRLKPVEKKVFAENSIMSLDERISTYPEIVLIAAMDPNRGIGYCGSIPWESKEDMENFRKVTSGHSVIMGRRTYESLKAPLPNRTNYVVSKTIKELPGCKVHSNLSDVLKDIPANETAFIIGGSVLYEEAMPLASKLILTTIDTYHSCDTFFPKIKGRFFLQSEEKIPNGTIRTFIKPERF